MAWQASSTIGTPACPAIRQSGSISAHCPNRCTGNMARVRGVTAFYGRVMALRGVDLEVQDGEQVCDCGGHVSPHWLANTMLWMPCFGGL